MNLKYLIIEDNPGALKNLQTALNSHNELHDLGFAHTAADGVYKAQTEQPHIIFLDVELGQENGFDVLKEIRQQSGELPYFIMTTDHDKYAAEAVNTDVLYFLEKPIDPDELKLALIKAKRKFSEIENQITIKNTEGHNFIYLDEIQFIEADGNTCIFHIENGEKMFVTKTMKKIDSSLPPKFLRIHKSYIINKNLVELLNTTQRKLILRLNHEKREFPVGKSYLERVRNVLLMGWM